MSQQSLVRAAQRAAALLAAAVLASCANMLTGNDVTQSISTEVTAANAKTSEITVRIDPAMNGGTISAPGFKSVQKVGIPFNLSVDVGTNFAFKGWTVLGDGSLKIIDAALPATSATIYKTAWKDPTVIQANFFRRPTLTINPINGGEVVNRNRKILLRFDHAMDPATLLLPDSVMVTENAMTNGAGWADVTKTYFSEILPNDKAGMEYYLAFASNGTLLKPYTYYKITVLKQAADTNGVTMVDDVVSQFSTGASADNSPPSITTYVGASAATPDTNRSTTLFTNASTVYLSVTAIDDSGAVPTLTIQELFGSDPANPLKSRSNTMTTTAGYFEYLLNAAWGEGPRTIAVQGTDSIGNVSAATEKNAQVLVFYDTTKPEISSFPLKGLTNSASQTLNLAASDTQGSGLASYVLTGDVVAGPVRQATEAGTAQLAFNLPAGDGPKKITLTVTDKAGNTSEETKTLVLDTLAPQAPSLPTKILGRSDAFNASETSTQFRVAFTEDVQIGDTLSVVLNGKPLSVSALGPTAVSERSQVLTVSADSLGSDGTLTLISQVTDQAGNIGAESPVLTLLKDTGLPSLVLGSLVSNNSFDSSFARTGDQVSLTFTPSDANLTGTATVVLGGVSQSAPLVSGTPVTVRQVVGVKADGQMDYSVTVSDAAGNALSTTTGAQGSVTIDNTAPAFELGTFASSNASNTLFAKDGDTITLNFRLNETNLDPVKLTGTFAGKPVTITPLGGGNYKASVQVTASWNDGTSYPVAYSLSAVDKAGNSTNVDAGATGTVTVDFSQPSFGLPTLVSNNPVYPQKYAKVGETITMRFTAAAQGSALTDVRGVIAGHEVAAVFQGGSQYEATYILTAADTEGPVTFQIKASNQTGRVFTTNFTEPSEVVFDRTTPQVIIDSFLSDNGTDHAFARLTPQADRLTLKFRATDLSLQGTASVSIAGLNQSVSTGGTSEASVIPSVLSEGAVPFSITVSDKAGNTTLVTQASPGVPQVTADTAAPVIRLISMTSSNNDHGWAKKDDDITVTFTVDDANPKTPVVSIAGKSATVTSTGASTYSAFWKVKADDTQSTVTFEIQAGDRAGNLTTTSTGAAGSVKIDTVVPAITLGTLKSNNVYHVEYATKDNTASLTFTGTDSNLKSDGKVTLGGVEQTVGGLVTTVSRTVPQLLTTAPDGILAYSVTLTDQAGNSTTATSGATSMVTVDNVKPVLTWVTLKSNNSTNTAFARNDNSVTLSFRVDDLHLTDAVNPFARADGTLAGNTVFTTAISSGLTASVSTTLSGLTPAQDRLVDYTLTVKDLAGNTAVVPGPALDTVTIDNTPPEITMGTQTSDNAKDSTHWAKAGNTVTQKFTVTELNLKTVEGTLADVAVTPSDLTGGVYSLERLVLANDAQGAIHYSAAATDQAGNVGSVVNTDSVGVIQIDTVTPVVTVGVPSKSKMNNSGTVTFGVSYNDTNLQTDHLAASLVGLNSTLASGASVAPSATKSGIASTLVTLSSCTGDGTLGLTILAGAGEDYAGNLSTASVPSATFLIDNTAPAIAGFSTTSPLNVTSLKGGTELAVTFSVTDPFNGSGIATFVPDVTFLCAGKSTSVSATLLGGSLYKATYTPLAGDTDGNISFTVVAKDDLANTQTTASLDTGRKLDNTKPSVTVNSITTSGNPGYAKDGDTVTVTFTVTEATGILAVGNPSVTIKDSADTKAASATVTGTFPAYTAKYVTNSAALFSQGNLRYRIDVTDEAGNAMIPMADTTLLCYDNIPVSVTSLSLASNNTATTWAKAGNIITLGFQASDTNWTSVGSTALIAGRSSVLDLSGTGKTASLTVVPGDTQGTAGYDLVLYDLAGNKTEVTSGASGSVTIDTVDPALTLGTLSSNNTTNTAFAKDGDTLTLGFQATDLHLDRADGFVAGKAVSAATLVSGGASQVPAALSGMAPTDGQASYTLTVKDLAGNSVTLTSGALGTVTVDNTPPVITMGSQTSNNAKSTTLWAKAGNTVTQLFKVTEKNTRTVSGKLANETLTPSDLGSPGTDQRNYSLARVVAAGDAQGAITYSATATDQAGNTATLINSGATGTIQIDTEVPIVTVAAPSQNKANSSGTVTFAVSATDDNAITDHLAISLVSLNSALASGALTSPSAAKAVTSTQVTLTNCTGDGTLGITLMEGAKEDAAGNLSAATAPSAAVQIDNTAPVVSGFAAAGPAGPFLKGGSAVTVTFTASDPYGGTGITTAPQVTFASGAATSTVSATFSVDHYEASYTPTTAVNASGAILCTIEVKDTLLNAVTSSNLDSGKTLDNIKPSVTVDSITTSGNSGFAKDGDTVTLTFTVTEASGSLASGYPSVSIKDSDNVKAATATVTGTFPTYTAQFVTNSEALFSQGNLRYRIDVTDVAGNAMDPLAAATTVCYDNIPPTVTFGPPSRAWTNSQTAVTFSLTYNDSNALAATSTDTGLITLVSTGSVTGTTVTLPTGTQARLVNASGEGTTAISVKAGYFTDAAGNPSTASVTSSAFGVDNTAPTVTIGARSRAWANKTATVTYDLTYSDNNTSVFSSGGAGEITRHKTGSPTDGTLTKPSANRISITGCDGEGTMAFSANAGFITDEAGNASEASATSAAFGVDNTAPAVAIGAPSRAWANKSAAVTYELTYSDNTTTVFTSGGAGAITRHTTGTPTNGTITKPSDNQISITGCDGEGTMALSVNAGFIADEAGNTSLASATSTAFGVDNTAPTVAIGSPSRAWTNSANPVTYSLTYQDAHPLGSTSTDAGLITVDASVGVTGVVATLPSDGVVSLVGASSEGTVAISVQAGYFTDAAGNASEASVTSAAFSVDNTRPNVTIGAPSRAWANKSTAVTYSLTYSDNNSTVFSPGGAAAVTAHATGSATTGTITRPLTNQVSITGCEGEGTMAISVNAGFITDEAGNTSLVSATSATFGVDNTAPTVTISGPSRAWTNSTNPVSYTLTYHDDHPLGSTSSNTGLITVDTSVGVSGVVATLPSDGVVSLVGATAEGTVAISVLSGYFTDAAGNASEPSATSTAYGIDLTEPSLALTNIVSSNASGAWAKANDTLNFTFTGSDTHWDKVDATIVGHSTTVTGADRTGYVTVEGSDHAKAITYTLVATDLAGNTKTITDTKTGITIDTQPPVVSIAGPTYESDVKAVYTLTTTELTPAYTLTAANLTLTDAPTPTITDASSLTATVAFNNPTGVGALKFSVNAGIVADLAGNLNAATGFSLAAAYTGSKFTDYVPPVGGYLAGERTLPGTKSRFGAPVVVSPAPTVWTMVTEAFLPPPTLEFTTAASVPESFTPSRVRAAPLAYPAAWVATPATPTTTPISAPRQTVITAPMAPSPVNVPANAEPTPAPVRPSSPTPSPILAPVPSPSPLNTAIASVPASTAPPSSPAPLPVPVPERTPSGYPPLWNQVVEERRQRRPGLV